MRRIPCLQVRLSLQPEPQGLLQSQVRVAYCLECRQTLLCRRPWLVLEMMTMPMEWTLALEVLRNLPAKVPLVVVEVLAVIVSAVVEAYRRLL